MNAKHTELPFRVGDAGHTIFGPPVGPPNGPTAPLIVAQRLLPDDARFIARACNSHYELLEALRGMLDRFQVDTPDGYHDPGGVIRRARTAIAKAEGSAVA